MPGLSLSIRLAASQGGGVPEETVIEGPGGVGSPIGLLLVLTKAS